MMVNQVLSCLSGDRGGRRRIKDRRFRVATRLVSERRTGLCRRSGWDRRYMHEPVAKDFDRRLVNCGRCNETITEQRKEAAMSKTPDLSQFHFFSDISRDRLAEIESFGIVQDFARGDIVFRDNEPARNLYCLNEGEINLSLTFREDVVTRDIKYEEYRHTNVETQEKAVVIEKVKSHEIFGWSALVEPERMTATAVCETDCRIILIPASELKRIFGTDPQLAYHLTSRISSLIAGRLKSRTDKLVEAWCALFEAEKIHTV